MVWSLFFPQHLKILHPQHVSSSTSQLTTTIGVEYLSTLYPLVYHLYPAIWVVPDNGFIQQKASYGCD